MKFHSVIAVIVALLAASALRAAPTTDLGAEIFLPLDASNGFALIDKASGQMRLGSVNAANDILFATPLATDLPGVTGATSGYIDGGQEKLVLASATANRLALVTPGLGTSSFLFPAEPGPALPVHVRRGVVFPQNLLLANHFTPGGHTLQLYQEPFAGFTLLDTTAPFPAITNLQPLNVTNLVRYATGGVDNGLTFHHFIAYVSAAPLSQSFYNFHPTGTLLASNVVRDDGELMIVGYVPGSPTLGLIRVGTPLGFPPIVDPTVNRALPVTVGKVAAALTAAGEPDGFLATAANGAGAAHYRIDPLNNLVLVQGFTPPVGEDVHGLLPVPGRGIVLLSGPPKGSASTFQFYTWNGAAWNLEDTVTNLPPPPPGPDFATLFWYDSEPLVDPLAQLLDLDLQPDWTSKSVVAAPADLPADYFFETFTGGGTGLDNPTIFAPTAPAGATHVIANQYLDSVSLTACADDATLIIPTLSVTPDSGTYKDPVTVTADFDEDLYTVFFREDKFGEPWQTYDLPLTVSYPSTWQFYAQNTTTLMNGPVVSRSYNFDPADFATFDADEDYVPDYVEIANGLDPNSGADADADTFTDLDEIINGSDPNDDTSVPGAPTYPFTGEGFVLYAQATDSSAAEASDGDPNDAANLTDGEPIDLHTMSSALLASAPVESLATPPSLVGQLAATLNAGAPVAAREWVILSSPVYFNLDGPDPEVRGGREVYRVLQRPVQNPPPINPVVTGTDLAADAAAWTALAGAVYFGFEQNSSRTLVQPIDTARAAAAEAGLYAALQNLPSDQQGALCVPQNGPADLPPAPTTVAIAADATYLRVESDPAAVAATAIDLGVLGLAAGDIIVMRTAGGYARNVVDPEDSADLVGVFSASATILPGNNSNRIPDAIDAGTDFVTPVTAVGGFTTDIPEDFLISSQGDNPYFDPIANPVDPPFPDLRDVCLTIPAGATHLFVSPVSDFFGDNSAASFDLEIFSRQFTLFGNRDADSERSPLTEPMIAALVSDGLSLENLLAGIEGAAIPNIETLTDAIYDYHVAHSDPTALPGDTIPLLTLPLDVLRDLASGGDLDSSYAAGMIVPPAVVDDAKAEFAALLAQVPAAYRPTDTWTVEVGAPLTPDARYSYTNLGSGNPAVFFDSEGDPFDPDQGLGLAIGTRFTVTGYIDVTGPAGFDAMELISIDVVFTPTPSDNDTDGNLLGDAWELFFFGALGTVDAFDTHPINGFTYLQLYLIGHDPRADCAEIPAVDPVFFLGQVIIVPIAPDEFALEFDFPDAYFEFFDFQVEESTIVAGFTPLATAPPYSAGTDLYQIALGVPASGLDENFFRLLISLK